MQNLSVTELSERTLRRATSHLVNGILAVRGRPREHYESFGLPLNDRRIVVSRVKERLAEEGYSIAEADRTEDVLLQLLGAN